MEPLFDRVQRGDDAVIRVEVEKINPHFAVAFHGAQFPRRPAEDRDVACPRVSGRELRFGAASASATPSLDYEEAVVSADQTLAAVLIVVRRDHMVARRFEH